MYYGVGWGGVGGGSEELASVGHFKGDGHLNLAEIQRGHIYLSNSQRGNSFFTTRLLEK